MARKPKIIELDPEYSSDNCPFLRMTNEWQDAEDPLYSGCDYECEHPSKKDGKCPRRGFIGCPLKRQPVLIKIKA